MTQELKQPVNSGNGLQGRRALVTGGASGIGLACAQSLSDAGAIVTIADLNEEAANQAAASLGGKAWAVDLSDTKALESCSVDTDILINNAGVQRVAPIHEFDPEAWRLIHRLMLEAPFLLIRAALPGMRERGFGRIINISSVHGLRASAFKSAYVSAKHGLEGLSKVTALEGAEHGITSNCINPGYVRTALVEKQIADQAKIHQIPEADVVQKIMLTEAAIKRLVEPEEVASLATWLSADAAGMVTGASYTMDGGWSAR
ncbi:3-hydroxybutyrate dehydrogenase [Glutamicibacter sp. AOP5-A2-18]|uniref:3-hydroxybutyrate dehydrogenase n=1 Tax=Glutamicibacter sp. AOP5-A2-18 TaxID=3457656 RepID=UPI004033B368